MSRLIFILTLLLASCGPRPAPVSPAESATVTDPTSPPTREPVREISVPPMDASWHIQYTGELNLNLDVDLYNLDLFDTAPDAIQQLHDRGIYVMCYFSAGSFEDWRPDASQFPAAVLGNDMEGWPGEKWLDFRQIDLLEPIISARLDLAMEKGCNGVDPDNVNGYTNMTGFTLSDEDQLEFNIWLAESAHARGLAIGLKNDIEQIPDLLPHFDWELNEQCFFYEECDLLSPFIEAGKPVFNIEYELNAAEFCPEANQLGFNSIRKNWDLDEYVEPCK